jgi:hypothetical protein
LTDRAEYIKEAKAKFDAFDTNEWVKACFDEHSGGFAVYHKDHSFDPTIGKYGIPRSCYETNASKVLSVYGMAVVLKSDKTGANDAYYDGFLNGIPFEIKGVEVKTKRIIKDKISEASGQKAEIAVLYFHDKGLYDKDFVVEGYRQYLRNSKSKRIRTVYCVVGEHLYKVS